MDRFKLEITACVSGALVMILEIVGSRVVAPYLGNSLITWTSLIGIILGSLSLGYWFGGRIADRHTNQHILAFILALAGLGVFITALIHHGVLMVLAGSINDLRISTPIAAIILFAPSTVLFGMVTPYITRLSLENLEHSGRVVGRLYALSTIGSIAGTFLAGFFLIALLGTVHILYLLALVSFLTAVVVAPRKRGLFAGMLILLGASLLAPPATGKISGLVRDTDTRYHRAWIYDTHIPIAQGLVRMLTTNADGIQSAVSLEHPDEPVFSYIKMYRLAEAFTPQLKTALTLGGGAYTQPRDFLLRNPRATLAVVELDAGLTELAREYFFLEDNPRLTIIHDDARIFLNRAAGQYDAIFVDIFSTHTPPHYLTTKESFEQVRDLLAPEGVVMINSISALQGPDSKFFQAEYATLASVFSQVRVYRTQSDVDPNKIQNIMFVARMTKTEPKTIDPELLDYREKQWKEAPENSVPILTDDFAPVDQYTYFFPQDF